MTYALRDHVTFVFQSSFNNNDDKDKNDKIILQYSYSMLNSYKAETLVVKINTVQTNGF